MQEQVLFSLPLERLEPIFKKWFHDVLTSQPQATSIIPASTPDPIRLFGDKAAAKYLNCSIMTVQNLRRTGAIGFYRTGRKVFYISNELDEALKVQSRKFGLKSIQ